MCPPVEPDEDEARSRPQSGHSVEDNGGNLDLVRRSHLSTTNTLQGI